MRTAGFLEAGGLGGICLGVGAWGLGLGRVFSRYGLGAAEPAGVYVAEARTGFEEDWNVAEVRVEPAEGAEASFGSKNLVT